MFIHDSRCSVAKGIRCAKTGQYTEAMKYYTEALDIQPRCVDAYIAMGAAFVHQGNLPRGAQCFQKALSIDPTDGNAQKYLYGVKVKVSSSRCACHISVGCIKLQARGLDLDGKPLYSQRGLIPTPVQERSMPPGKDDLNQLINSDDEEYNRSIAYMQYRKRKRETQKHKDRKERKKYRRKRKGKHSHSSHNYSKK